MPRRKPTPTPPALEGYTFAEFAPLVRLTLEAGISVLLRGHPGAGKSTLAAAAAAPTTARSSPGSPTTTATPTCSSA